jgi:hypothetical protein
MFRLPRPKKHNGTSAIQEQFHAGGHRWVTRLRISLQAIHIAKLLNSQDGETQAAATT